MKAFRSIEAGIFLMCMFGLATASWSDDVLRVGKNAQEVVGSAAVVTKVEGDTVTLRSGAGEVTIPWSGMEELKVGDRVTVQGSFIRKMAGPSAPAARSASETMSPPERPTTAETTKPSATTTTITTTTTTRPSTTRPRPRTP